MTIDPGWPVAIALAALLVLALGAHRVAGYGLAPAVLVAALRALVQLGVVALLITAVIDSLALSGLLVLVMFGMGVLTTTRRVEAAPAWPWAALAMACGVVPVLVVVLASGAIPFEGIAVIPVAGIIVGNAMTGHTLLGRRAFAALREEADQYEACLSLGMLPAQAIDRVRPPPRPRGAAPRPGPGEDHRRGHLPRRIHRRAARRRPPAQAATAQALVLFGIMAAQTVTVARRLSGWSRPGCCCPRTCASGCTTEHRRRVHTIG